MYPSPAPFADGALTAPELLPAPDAEMEVVARTPRSPSVSTQVAMQTPLSSANEAAASLAAQEFATEASSLRSRVVELQSQCDRGVALIERLKARLAQQEKERQQLVRRNTELGKRVQAAESRAASASATAMAGAASAEKAQVELARTREEHSALRREHQALGATLREEQAKALAEKVGDLRLISA